MSAPLDAPPLAPPLFSRPTWAEISLSALRHNARALHRALGVPLLAVIKANAYGHGAVPVAETLQPLNDATGTPLVTIFGVASVDEGVQLREAGITTPILLLSAILPQEAAAAVEWDLMPTLFTREVACALNDAATQSGKPARAHFKIDTGMARLGVHWREAAPLWREISALPHLQIAGVYTHFASADEAPDDLTREQLCRFKSALGSCGIARGQTTLHAANSAGALRFSEARFDLARTGLTLWGANPAPELCGGIALEPVMAWRSRVTFVKSVAHGQSVSYGATWRAGRPSRIATVPVGYADGYSRCLSGRAQVLVRGARVPVVGRVTMDQLLLDVTDCPVPVGEPVTLWGSDGAARLHVEEVAAWAGTIAYELLCGVGARVPRLYGSQS